MTDDCGRSRDPISTDELDESLRRLERMLSGLLHCLVSGEQIGMYGILLVRVNTICATRSLFVVFWHICAMRCCRSVAVLKTKDCERHTAVVLHRKCVHLPTVRQRRSYSW